MSGFRLHIILILYFYTNGISAQNQDSLKQELRLFRQEIVDKITDIAENQYKLREDVSQVKEQIGSLRDVSQCQHSATQIYNLVRHLKRNDEEREQHFELVAEKLSSMDSLQEKIDELDKGMRGATVKLWVIERLPGYLKKVEEKLNQIQALIQDNVVRKGAAMDKGGNLVSARGHIPDKIDLSSIDQDSSHEDTSNGILERILNPLQSSVINMEKEITEMLNQMAKLVESQDVGNSGITNLMDAIITTGESCNHQVLTMKNTGKSLETQIQAVHTTLTSIESSADWRYNINKDALNRIRDQLKNIHAAVSYGAELIPANPGSTIAPDRRSPYQSDRDDAVKDADRTDGCAIRRLAGDVQSGIVSDDKGGPYYTRYCDQSTDGGGWTVIQRRGYFGDPQINFTTTWKEYKTGFGDKYKEFWFGNDYIHRLTSEEDMVLRIELEDFENNYVYAEYKTFRVGDETSQYRLQVGAYSGNATDSFTAHDDSMFSTVDRNNDQSPVCCPCAPSYGGGWWFFKCFESNLNGAWLPNPTDNDYYRGIIWEHWRGDYSLKRATMKTRPLWFHQRIRGEDVIHDTDLLTKH